ncbi:bifunctional glutamate--cysteine ligase GshA/glutathione synthetase GshB [Fundicoccus culcitae]|uniref:glutamate--cysteine ligase n=1 Tax=Fundicoccus culcitae TaxID=2969821 RepID=A0ABY5P5P2_9LACT|nr:bifunctional glutamate--cysteine ligase GshA/glutathione synthetase GshB [Fundicoccus culcitae]UUX33718.1 bifunctional glutamate--cysteine ligase GshA/glutathione synthetase GshB [Fundicoccus culcitae]
MAKQTFSFNQADIVTLWASTIGIERETLRINHDGSSAQTPHSPEWGDRNHQPYIQTDFGENQLEFITPPSSSTDEILQWLAALHQIVAQTNEKQGELLWPFSMPGKIPTNRDDIKVAQLTNQTELHYREHLADYYGKDVQLLSGIHYNLKINPATIEKHCPAGADYIEFSNQVYSKLARNFMRYRWILTYLLGAAPFVDESYATNLYGKPHTPIMRSIRQSRYGYQNHPSIQISYESLEAFVNDLEAAVESKALSVEKELYRDVRFRRAQPVRQLIEQGINYLEFRNFDINPFAPYGIWQEDMEFIRLFILSLLYIEDAATDEAIDLGQDYQFKTAEDHPLNPPINISEAEMVFAVMRELAVILDEHQLYKGSMVALVDKKGRLLNQPELTLSGQLFEIVQTPDNFLSLGMELAEEHQRTYIAHPYSLHGFESFELSTQDVIKEAIRHGIEVTVIDAKENLIKLDYDGHVEFVKNGNMTRHDSLISYFLMENKIATKVILDEAAVRVPAGLSFNTFEEGRTYYSQLTLDAFVIKPKNTNYGLGITIFEEKPTLDRYVKALEFAFAEDDTVLLEAFAKGTELRFYVQEGEVKAIVERQPAQVIGDGQSTVSQLIDQTNADPLRGKKHLAPLTFIEKGEAEMALLDAAGLSLESIPDSGQLVYLRRNSNISTGGLSIDRTDEVNASYKFIAVTAANALGANFCGVDIIMEDYSVAASNTNYHVIEANFNPMITLHRYPGVGKQRPVGRWVLEQLYPEIEFNTTF